MRKAFLVSQRDPYRRCWARCWAAKASPSFTDVAAKPYVEAGALRRVLAGWTAPEVDFNAVFPGGRMMSPKVRAFVDFLVERLSSNADYMMVHCPSQCASAAAASAAEAEAGDARSDGERILAQVTQS